MWQVETKIRAKIVKQKAETWHWEPAKPVCSLENKPLVARMRGYDGAGLLTPGGGFGTLIVFCVLKTSLKYYQTNVSSTYFDRFFLALRRLNTPILLSQSQINSSTQLKSSWGSWGGSLDIYMENVPWGKKNTLMSELKKWQFCIWAFLPGNVNCKTCQLRFAPSLPAHVYLICSFAPWNLHKDYLMLTTISILTPMAFPLRVLFWFPQALSSFLAVPIHSIFIHNSSNVYQIVL